MKPIPEAPGLGRPYRVGDRVCVTALKGPKHRCGEIVALHPSQGGAMVAHDRGVELGSPFGRRQVFAWLWNEIEPEAT